MGWFKKKPDPITDRARVLSDEIAALEAQIKELDRALQTEPASPKVRAAALPHSGKAAVVEPPQQRGAEPIFEQVDQALLRSRVDGTSTSAHYNELGVRKYDLTALVRRFKNHFRGPAATNPKLVSYLAAGGIQGLRPLRYEKRVARNRFIFLVTGLFLMLLGLLWMLVRTGR
jgi:hypothetical protein